MDLKSRSCGTRSLLHPRCSSRRTSSEKLAASSGCPRSASPRSACSTPMATSSDTYRPRDRAFAIPAGPAITRKCGSRPCTGSPSGSSAWPWEPPFAEQLSASGAELILSITSAGQIRSLGDPPYFVLITKALRDEGTSHHYQSPSDWSLLASALEERLVPALRDLSEPVLPGISWTTDAPYRETQNAVDAAETDGINCVEMEAAALYAYGAARQRDIVCFAHITNSMAVNGNDFEKGAANGALSALEITEAAARTLLSA